MSQSRKSVKTTNQATADQATTIVGAQWSAPLPHPTDLQAFDHIIQNGAERIMRMAEQEQQHRFALEKANIEAQSETIQIARFKARSDVKTDRLSRLMGMVVVLLCIAGATYLAKDAPWVAACLVGVPMASIIKALLPR